MSGMDRVLVLYSNRRMGKSSLLKEFARRNRSEFIFAYVDLYGVTNKSKFLNHWWEK